MLKENFVEMIRESIQSNWDLPAFSNYKEAEMTYGQVAEQILRLHYVFKKGGLKRGDKVVLIGRNSGNWALVYLATVTYGAVIVPVLPDFHMDDFYHIIHHSDAEAAFIAESIHEKMDPSKLNNTGAIFSLDDFKLLGGKGKGYEKALAEADDNYLEDKGGKLTTENIAFEKVDNGQEAGIIYTSGTSGFSKGVVLQHNSLAANVRFARNNIPLKAGDPILSFLPTAHTFGCTFDFLFPFMVGCHVTFLGQIPSPTILVQALGKIKPRLILSVPLLIEKIYRKQVKPKLEKGAVKILTKIPGLGGVIYKKIRNKLVGVFGGNFIEIVIGGAALNEEVESFLKRIHFPFTVGYGMTECGPLISYTPFPHNPPGAVGKVMDTLEVRIDSTVTGTTDGSGEIQVRGENVMTGYYKNEDATTETIDKDGWLHTGDIGVLDKQGFIYIKGRHKSMLLGPSGQNIYPEEIEAQLNNLPYVEESLVIQKDDKSLVALVYPNQEAMDADGLDKKQLQEKMEANRQMLNKQIPIYCRVAKIELYPEEFQKTPTRKIKRYLYTKTHA